MRLKVISNGIGNGTKIINSDTGEVLEGVQHATWECEAGGVSKLTLHVVNVSAEFETHDELKSFINIVCNNKGVELNNV